MLIGGYHKAIFAHWDPNTMKPIFRTWLVLVTALASLMAVTGAYAQAAPRIAYYLAPDASNVRQVYQVSTGTTATKPRQITHASSDVLAYGAAYDGLSVAYVADQQLWLQPLHTGEAESLTPIQSTDFLDSPVFSQDGQYVAYTDDGIWLYDLGTRQTRQLVANVNLRVESNVPNAGQVRAYSPTEFIPAAKGNPAKLSVGIGLWESVSVGLIDLTSGTAQELVDRRHSGMLPIYGGRALLYGNTPIDGDASLSIVPQLDAIGTSTKVLAFQQVSNTPLYAQRAVVFDKSFVRVLGRVTASPSDNLFYFDYDLRTGQASSVAVVPLTGRIDASYMILGPLSSDGRLLALYENVTVDTPRGRIRILDLRTSTLVATSIPEDTSDFQWQPAAQ